jgi:3-methylcrotonyl-CoA carboxylase alpha subunit
MKWVVRGTAAGPHEVEVERTTEGFEVVVDGQRQVVDMVCLDGAIASLRFIEDGRSFQVSYQSTAERRFRVAVLDREFDLAVLTPVEASEAGAAADRQGPSRISAPIPGKVVAVKVAAGDEVEVGQTMIVLEAMKMENELEAEQSGRVVAVQVEAGATVEAGELLVELE